MSSVKAPAQMLKRIPYGVLKTGSRHLERIIVWDSPHPREKAKESSKHIENLYVERPQFATLLLPLTSTDCYPDGNSPGKHHGKQRKIEP
jgi:hypothetical protein